MDIENSPSNIIKKGLTKPVKLNNDVTILPSSKVSIFFLYEDWFALVFGYVLIVLILNHIGNFSLLNLIK